MQVGFVHKCILLSFIELCILCQQRALLTFCLLLQFFIIRYFQKLSIVSESHWVWHGFS